MDMLEAMSLGITYRSQLPDGDPGKQMTDQDMLRIIQTNINTSQAVHRPSINYADPTGDMAAARADRSRR